MHGEGGRRAGVGPAARDGTYVALIRGINVGRAKRVAMADLRSLVSELGYTDVRTVLNSGNVVFAAPAGGDAAARIEAGLRAKFGITARVCVLDAPELSAVIAQNPLLSVATDHARLLAAIWRDSSQCARLDELVQREWSPSILRIGTRAAYLWCPAGVLASPLFESVNRTLGDGVTMRNWATIVKLEARMNDRR